MKNGSANNNAKNSAGRFLDRVRDAAMTIRRQQLQCLQQYGATENDQAHQRDLPRIRHTK